MVRLSRRSLRQRKLRGWIGYLLFFLLGSLVAFGGYHYLIREKSLSPEAFSQKVFIADQIVHSQLYELGLSKKEILLQQSLSKRERDFTWEQSLLKIQIPQSLSFSLIEKNFARSLSHLGKPFSIQSSRALESLQFEVKVMDRMTHQITFLYAKPPEAKGGLQPKIVIVIDDLGGEDSVSQELLQENLPVTFSILPFTSRAKALALEANRKGKEIILHLPMEPQGYPKINPGKGALLHEMSEEELLRQLSKDIEAVPYIKGVSNHMGSQLMEDPEKIRIILSELKKRGLFFLDSRTTPHTVGLQTAQSLGLKATERNVFLDNSTNGNDVKRQIEQLIQISLSTGKAIGIGHPHPSTIKSLKEMIPKIKEKGIEIVSLSEMMQ
jgi:polysaccharide deacetylase 2 family uncharacterized protein YibQ